MFLQLNDRLAPVQNPVKWFLKLSIAIACVVVLVTSLTACGGNGSSAPTGPNGNTGILNALNNSTNSSTQGTLPAGTDTTSMASFWEKQVLNGFTKTSVLKGYAYQDFPRQNFNVVPTGSADNGKSTLVLITHQDHNAQNGDIVTLSGVTQNLWDIPFSVFNGSFEIIGKDANAYYIKLPFATAKRELAVLSANLSYKYTECMGNQKVVQTPALPTDPTTFLDGYEARVAKYTVENSSTGCSPPAASFTSYKYYAVYNPRPGFALNYPLLGQRVVGGDFGTFENTFDLPTAALKSGDKGNIGTMKFYTASNKVAYIGRAVLTYEILKNTASSVFIVIATETYTENNFLVSKMTEVYGRDPAVDKEYKLIRTTVKYNNPRRNEVVIE